MAISFPGTLFPVVLIKGFLINFPKWIGLSESFAAVVFGFLFYCIVENILNRLLLIYYDVGSNTFREKNSD